MKREIAAMKDMDIRMMLILVKINIFEKILIIIFLN